MNEVLLFFGVLGAALLAIFGAVAVAIGASEIVFIAPGSVYALHPVTEETARRAAATWRPEPVSRWELPALPAEPETFQEAADFRAEDLGDDEYDEELEALQR